MRRSAAAIAGVLGVLCLSLFPMTAARSQLANELSIYDASGIGQGIVATFAVRPSIFDPLAQGGLFYTQTQTTSQGGGRSYSIASQAFPGTFVIGAVGCGGLPGGSFVQGSYPETDSCPRKQETTLYKPEKSGGPLDAVIDHAQFELTHIRASGDLGKSDSLVESIQYGIIGADGTPIITVKDFDLVGTSRASATQVNQETIIVSKGVKLLNGGINIDVMRSIARTSTNGIAATADATIAFSGVTVTIDGKQRKATIDESGIHVTDPALDQKQRLGADEQVQEGLARGGVKISASSPSEIVEGARAEASVGGLSIAFSGTIPSVAVPSDLTPVLGRVLDEIPTQCLSDFGAPLPLCFGAGVLPGFGSGFPLTLQIGNVNAFSAASTAPAFDLGTGPGTTPFTPTDQPGGITFPNAGVETPVGPGAPPAQEPAQPPFQQEGDLRGLVARFPAVALLWVGAALLIVAVGVGLGPSLPHAGRT